MLKILSLSFIELCVCVLLIYGFINEKKVITFEQNVFRFVKIYIRNFIKCIIKGEDLTTK